MEIVSNDVLNRSNCKVIERVYRTFEVMTEILKEFFLLEVLIILITYVEVVSGTLTVMKCFFLYNNVLSYPLLQQIVIEKLDHY